MRADADGGMSKRVTRNDAALHRNGTARLETPGTRAFETTSQRWNGHCCLLRRESAMKSGRRKTKLPGFVPLRDLVPRNDPIGGSARKTVFGEPPPVRDPDDEPPFQEPPLERRRKPGHERRGK